MFVVLRWNSVVYVAMSKTQSISLEGTLTLTEVKDVDDS